MQVVLRPDVYYPGITPGYNYYAFPNGNDYVYISLYDNPNSHFGCYRKKLFSVVEDPHDPDEIESPETKETALPAIESNPGSTNVFIGHLLQPTGKYPHLERKEYFLKERDSGTHVDFFETEDCIKRLGVFPLDWFMDVQYYGEYLEIKKEAEILPPEEWQQLTLF